MNKTLSYILNLAATTLAAAAGTFLAESLRKEKKTDNKLADVWEEPYDAALEDGPVISEDFDSTHWERERFYKALDLADEAYKKAEMYRRAYAGLWLAANEKGIEIEDHVEDDEVYFDYGYLRDRMDLDWDYMGNLGFQRPEAPHV